MNFASISNLLLKGFSNWKRKIQNSGNRMTLGEKSLRIWKMILMVWKKMLILSQKKMTVWKKEISNISKKFSKWSEKFEKILSAQIPYFNKFDLGMNNETTPLIDFPKVMEKLRQRPSKSFYKNHFKKVFVKPIGRNALKCSKCNSSDYFENKCPKV